MPCINLRGVAADFFCASGALAFDGKGWWYEWPWRWAGMMDPREMVVITKTLTLGPRDGNYRWYCPWRCIRPTEDGFVNAVALTNPGLHFWIDKIWPTMRGLKTVVSFSPDTYIDAGLMVSEFNKLDLLAVELNLSCPNVKSSEDSLRHMRMVIDRCLQRSMHPLIVKLGVSDPVLELCKSFDGQVAAWDLINSVPWDVIRPGQKSPLSRYGLKGGVSGKCIKLHARQTLKMVKEAGIKTPVISGGGIDGEEEIKVRYGLGADAISFGTIFITKPWLPNKLIKKFRK